MGSIATGAGRNLRPGVSSGTAAAAYLRGAHVVGSEWVETKWWRCVLLISVAYLPLAFLMAHAQRMSSDEIYTYHIAQQPTIAAMIHLSRQIDLHPPLHFLLQRAALTLELPRWLSSRLPSLLAGWVGLIAIFGLVARRFGNLFGLLAASLYWFTPATNFGWSNRPYAIWLCFLALTAFFWSLTSEWRRPWWVPLAIGLSGFAMVLDYMFGLPCLLAFLLAEAVRSYRRRRADVPVLAGLMLPFVAGISYCEQIRSFATNGFTQNYLPSFSMGVDVYIGLILLPLACLAGCWVFADIVAERSSYPPSSRSLQPEVWVMMVTLTVLPALLLIVAAIHHTQFFARYAACGCVGLALLLAYFVISFCDRARTVAFLLAIGMLIASAASCCLDTHDLMGAERPTAMGVSTKPLESLDPQLPIVVASATDFTELNDREPPLIAKRLYYLTDRGEAEKYSGQTLFETEDQTAPLLGLAGHAEPMTTFLKAHAKFYVLGDYMSSEEWSLRYMMDHRLPLAYLGKFKTTVAADDLFEVRNNQVLNSHANAEPSAK
jgi:hypothetical protein